MNLRMKILLPAVLTLLIGLSVCAFMIINLAENSLDVQLNQQTRIAHSTLSSVVLGWFSDFERALEDWSRHTSFADLLRNDPQNRQMAQALANAELNAAKKNHPEFDAIHLIGPEGLVIASSNAASVDTLKLGDRDYVAGPLQTGKFVTSAILISRRTNTPVIGAGYPVRDSGGKTIGVLAGIIDQTMLNKQSETALGIDRKQGFAFAYDHTGGLAFHPDAEKVGREEHKLDVASNAAAIKQIMTSGTSGIIKYRETDKDLRAVVERLKNGWVLITAFDESILSAPIVQMRKMSILIAAVLLLLGLIISIISANSISAPVVKAAEYISRISIGDIPEKITDDYQGEFKAIKDNLNSLIEAMLKISQAAHTIADGNLQVDLRERSAKDDLMRSLRMMVEKMNDALVKVKQAVDEVSSGSVQISDASQSLSQGATESAASLEQISASSTEIGSQARRNAEIATQAAGMSKASSNAARTGGEKMQQLNASMQEITESGQHISKIIKTIDGIAFQTNLLALNAAVEAARAGKYGKGFAVVADEVRNLAGRSAKAASETAELIEHSNQSIQKGNLIARETAQTLEEIVERITAVVDLVGEMASASSEQAEGINQISVGLSQIDQVTQQNTANAEETAAAAEELSSQAAELRHLVSLFTLRETDNHGDNDDYIETHAVPAMVKGLPGPERNETGQFLTWNDSLSVGVPSIDEQHQKLVSFLNRMFEALKKGKAESVVEEIMAELLDYTKYHFSHEEKLMLKYGYGGRENHLPLHKDLLARAVKYAEKVKKDKNTSTVIETLDFLKEWLLTHIAKEDMKYRAFFTANRVK